mmetsp:Transcript_17782/g.59975  ORF Transcript_17782/g.59975 Transcript_17782/m.59975 type:complete len:253 (+) Transcript_17782:4615-5373(+)
MPMRDTVAGEAKRRSCVSKRKLTLSPKAMRSPLGSVSRWLSSKTELSDSIHSGSTSPSQTIQDRTSSGSLTTLRAASVSTPSDHSRVSRSISPRSCVRGMDFGFMTYVFTAWPQACSAACSTRQTVDLPQPDGPTTTQPMRWSSASFSCSILRIWASSTWSENTLDRMATRIAASTSPPAMSDESTPGKTSPMSARKRPVSPNVSLDSVLTRTALMSSSPSSLPLRTPAFLAWSARLPAVFKMAFKARRPQS